MPADTHTYELIEKYLSGSLKGNELKDFKSKLKENRDLLREVEIYRQSILSIETAGDIRLKKQLNKINKQYKKELRASEKKGSTLTNKVIKSLEKVFEEFFVPLEDLISVRTDGKKSKDDINNAMFHYSSGDYDSALKIFEKILKTDTENIPAIFYSGISCLETNNTEKAEKHFRKVLRLDKDYFKAQATWYLALTYLKTYDIEKAIDAFESISPDSANYEPAKNALSILRKLKD